MAYTYEDQIAFIRDLYCPARAVTKETGMSWELILAQAALECGWGRRMLPGTNNVFNIKADPGWKGEKRLFNVPEQDKHGNVYHVDAWFRVYPSLAASLRDRTEFLRSNPRYAKAGLFDDGVKGTLAGEAAALLKAGYATDKQYVSKLEEVFRGRTMRRAIAAAQKRGCGDCLPMVEVTLKDGANIEMANARVKVEHDKKSSDVTTGPSGTFVVRVPPNSSAIMLKLFDDTKDAWIDLDPIEPPATAQSIAATIIAPTFVIPTSTRRHEKKPQGAAAPDEAKAAPPAPASANYTLYPIKEGDSLSSIGAAHGVSYQAIAALNGIQSPYIIRPHRVLKIPKKGMPQAAHAEPASARSPRMPVPPASLDTIYFRNSSGHPQTEAMLSLRAPWMKFAEAEFQKGVRRRAGSAHDPRILEYLTATDVKGGARTRDETPYCAAFVNWCLTKGGFRGNNSAWAHDFAHWGRPTRGNKPALGAVALLRFPGTQTHHVTFVAGLNNHGALLATLGGNQGDFHAVTHSTCPKSWVIAYRYPTDYPDHDDDYVLHAVQSSSGPVTATGTR
jgi:flagellar protein FlgJ